MAHLIDLWHWILANPVTALAYLSLVHMAASAIANATPTKSDDKVVEMVFKTIHAIALNFFHMKDDSREGNSDEHI